MASLFRRKKQPQTEEERLFAEYRKLEKRTQSLSNGIKSWKTSQLNLCKGQNKMSSCLKQVSKIGLDPSALTRCVDLITTQRHKMLDDVRLTTQASMQRLHSLFNNMNGATKKRAQAKSEADNLKKKVDKYYNQYPIPIEKYKNAVKIHKDATERHSKAHDNLLNDLRCISKGKYDFFEPCLESLLLAQLTYYKRVWKTLEPAIHEVESTETLSTAANMERLRSLSIVTGPQNNLKARMMSRKSTKAPGPPSAMS